MKNTNIAVKEIPKEEVFRWWLVLTKPQHHLTTKEIEFLSTFLTEDYYLRSKVTDKDLARQMLFSTTIRAKIMKKLNLSVGRFNNMLSNLRRKGVFGSDNVMEKFIPNIDLDAKDFRIIFQFKLV